MAKKKAKALEVRTLDFSRSTYQVEVFDPETKTSFYPFLQFDQNGLIKDSFCDCGQPAPCPHLESAQKWIFDGYSLPWHERFSLSFYNKMGQLYADQIGLENLPIIKEKKGSYRIQQGEQGVVITATNAAMITRIETILYEERKATPENSIKFSNLSAERIQRWRKGRADQELRFELSMWADLMKFLFWLQEKNKDASLRFKEISGQLPQEAMISFPSLKITFLFAKEDLPFFIESLKGQNSSLKVVTGTKKQILSIHFDPEKECLILEHQEEQERLSSGMQIGKWHYHPALGFTALTEDPLLEESVIPKEKVASFITKYREWIDRFLDQPLITGKQRRKHHLFFDEKGRLHIEAYLFEIGDLQKKETIDFGTWIYLKKVGFVSVDREIFPSVAFVIPKQEVSTFVSEHKLWLSDKKGFVTHLATLESSLYYQVDSEGRLHFLHEPLREMEPGSFDFGEWVYYAERGFFAKKRAKTGGHVRAGLILPPQSVARFIRENSEELENVKNFFLSHSPLVKNSLAIELQGQASLYVKPLYIFLPEYENRPFRFFGEYLYIEAGGFCLLPKESIIPEAFREPQLIHKEEVVDFLLEELPKLVSFVEELPIPLQPVHRCDLEIEYLVRTEEGGLKAKFSYHTEHGRLRAEELFKAIKEGHRFLFSSAGLIDTKSERFGWMKEKGLRVEEDCFILSTLDFMRLDAKEELLLHVEKSPIGGVTERLLTSLRTFTLEQGFDIKGLKSTLRLYQQTGLKWLWFLYCNGLSGLLCDDMGLGKTHQAMALLAAVSNQLKGKKPLFLVISPTSVIYHWQDKLAAFLPHLRVQMFHGLKRKLAHPEQGGVIITTYGIVRKERELFADLPIDLAIYDEVQVAKNPNSGIHKALKEINARMHVGLTGTPIENNLTELRALFELTLPGYLPKEAHFRSQYILPIERDNDLERKAQLVKLIKPFTLRRRKSEVLQELPSKSEDKLYCDLSEDQAGLYQETIEERKKALLLALRDPNEKVPYMHIFSLLASLKQICNHPALFKKEPAAYKKYDSGKWELFVELLAEALESEQKVVVFSQYLQMLDIIELYLQEKRVSYAQIRGETQDRRQQLDRFQNDPQVKVFLGSLQAAGLGIDLTAASVVIMYDRWWNSARENQAIDRVHRMGQKWGVQVYKLITKGTIEEKIDSMITKKGRLMEEIVTVDDQSTLKSLSRQELIELLEISH